jgi:hypothetical protein
VLRNDAGIASIEVPANSTTAKVFDAHGSSCDATAARARADHHT